MQRRDFLQSTLAFGAVGLLSGTGIANGFLVPEVEITKRKMTIAKLFASDVLKNCAKRYNLNAFVGKEIEEIIELLKEKDKDGMTPLHRAVKGIYDETISQHMITLGSDVHAKDNRGRTPLHYAAGWNPNVKVAKYLVENKPGMDSDIAGIREYVRWLFEHKDTDVNATDDTGSTPLHLAARFSINVEVVEYLISQDANVHAKDNAGKTPLHSTIHHYPNIAVLEYLISQGADVRARDNEGKTALNYASALLTEDEDPENGTLLCKTIELLSRALLRRVAV